MLEIFYILLLVVFGGLIIVTMTQYGVRRGMLKDQLDNLREKTELQQARLQANGEEFDTIVLELEILQQEQDSLEAQATCMGNLDQFNTTTPVKKEKNDHRPTRLVAPRHL
ncbi:MAG: hypothetical protein VX293_11275 [Candidatus Latescibacterota bacterium]|nr:hypothetical protein [Candidatus Latescibacterota bacterium]